MLLNLIYVGTLKFSYWGASIVELSLGGVFWVWFTCLIH